MMHSAELTSLTWTTMLATVPSQWTGYYGNVSHFVNHSCNPNLVVYCVWINTLDPRLPRICLFANRKIAKGEELTFDYNAKSADSSQNQSFTMSPGFASSDLPKSNGDMEDFKSEPDSASVSSMSNAESVNVLPVTNGLSEEPSQKGKDVVPPPSSSPPGPPAKQGSSCPHHHPHHHHPSPPFLPRILELPCQRPCP